MFDPSLYACASMLYFAQARDALLHQHPWLVYAGLGAVHLTMAVKRALLY